MTQDHSVDGLSLPLLDPEDLSESTAVFDSLLTAEGLLSRFDLDDSAVPEDEPTAEPVAEPEPTVAAEDEDLLPDTDGVSLPETIEGETAAERWARLASMPPQQEEKPVADERAWFVIHCYSGYEYKVKSNLEQRIESMDMQDYIYQVVVPTVEEIEIKEGKRRTVERCLFPGYIMVQMLLSDDSWYVVRNTPGVTGFVGMGNKPIPLRQEQVQGILRRMEAAAPQVRATFKPGQKVRIIEGPFADFIGVVDSIDEERTKLRALVSFFGRETPVELDFLQVEKA